LHSDDSTPKDTSVHQSESSGNRGPHRQLVALGILLFVFCSLECFLPVGSAIKIGADEDFELSKATLCLRGYHLYTEIWDDQPPLDTFLITELSRVFPRSILAARFPSMVAGALLLSSFFLIILRTNGLGPAAIASGMFLASPGFLELSSSCMQEVPALAPVVCSIALLLLAPRCPLTQIGAGILFGIALQMKLIGGLYVPLFELLIWLYRPADGHPLKRVSVSVAIFGLCAILTFIFLNCLTGNSLLVQIKQSWGAHFAATRVTSYGSPGEHGFDWFVLARNWDTTIPALVGVVFLVRNGAGTAAILFPLSWLTLTLIVFSCHKPWWSFYYVHNSLPLCWCAAIGVWSVYRIVNGIEKRLVIAGFALCFLSIWTWTGARVVLEVQAIRTRPKLYNSRVLKEIERFRPFTKFLFTDQPIYSFHADIPLPPKLAMISLKRVWSGRFSIQELIDELESIKPGLLLLANDTKEVPFQTLLSREYRLVYQDRVDRLYAHVSIAKKAPLHEVE